MSRRRAVYRGAVIGLGGIARDSHLPGFVCDPSRQHPLSHRGHGGWWSPASRRCRAFRISRVSQDVRDAGPIDFVDICTPTASHLELTLWALEQGYHVMCEKPVALNARRGRAHCRRGTRARDAS